jgi:MinD-like ATPase involved in chromosome partitioning or flagellar assembly
MNALTYGVDPSWNQLLYKFEAFSSTKALTKKAQLFSEEIIMEDIGWIFLKPEKQEEAPWELTHQLRQSYPTSRIILVIDEAFDPLETILYSRLADRYGCSVITSSFTGQDFILYLEQLIEIKKQKPTASEQAKVVTGWGLSPGSGVTTILSQVALMLAQGTGLQVGFLDLNFRSPDIKLMVNHPTTTKNYLQIQSDLTSKMLTPQSLKNAMVYHKGVSNLSYLFGSSRREYAGLVSKEEISELIRVAREIFDVIFLDVNAYPDNAATLQSLKDADIRWVITDGRESTSLSAWTDWYENVFSFFGLHLSDFQLILNKANHSSISLKTISGMMGIDGFASLPETNKSTYLDWAENIRWLSQQLAEQEGMEWVLENPVHKEAWFQRLIPWSKNRGVLR